MPNGPFTTFYDGTLHWSEVQSSDSQALYYSISLFFILFDDIKPLKLNAFKRTIE